LAFQEPADRSTAIIHDFKASVFGYAAAGVAAMIIIHWVVLSSPLGHAKWLDVVGAGVQQTTATMPAK
jgi:hypothetical protein